MHRGRVVIVCGAVGLFGCATAPARQPTPAGADPERTVLELRARNAGYVRRIEELENRVFILEDQLDSRALATEQKAPATLPRKSQPGGAGSASVANEAAEIPVETSLLAEHAVDYAGDAAVGAADAPTDSKRPMLRLSASRAPEPRAETPDRPARPGADPLKLYRNSLEILRAGHPAAARVGFRRFLDANPQHDFADNAQYWIGECDYAADNLSAAERAFRTVVERYPRGNKVPDAMLKLGFTLQAEGDDAAGRAVLQSLMRAFPRHEAARLAGVRLARPAEGAVSTAGAPSRGEETTLGTIIPAAVPLAAPAGAHVRTGAR